MSRKKKLSEQIAMELKFTRIKAAGSIRDRYPEVKAVHFDLTFVGYDNQVPPIHKELYLGPQQHAHFEFDCPYLECVSGGFDMQSIVNSMLQNKQPECKGEIKCMG